MRETLTAGQRRTAAAREALARKFPTQEEKTEHYRAMAAKANAGRIVLTGDEARVIIDAYALLGRIAERAQAKIDTNSQETAA